MRFLVYMCLVGLIATFVAPAFGLSLKDNHQDPIPPAPYMGKILPCGSDELNGGVEVLEDEDDPMPELVAVEGGNGSNICFGKRLVPECYVIGVVKAATSSFTLEMSEHPGIVCPKNPFTGAKQKEGQFFMRDEDMTDFFPACEKTRRLVGMESAPRYMLDHCLPGRIARFYGELKSRLTFVVLLREPLLRLQSDFYYGQQFGWCDWQKDMNFSQFVSQLLGGGYKKYTCAENKTRCGDGCSDRLEASLYANQLLRWFETFHPSQFIVIPFKHYIHHGRNGSLQDSAPVLLSKKLGISRSFADTVHHDNTNKHPKLSKDLTPGQLVAVRRLITKLNGSAAAVAEVVAERAPGATLFGYEGPLPPSRQAVAAWLEQGW